MTTPTADPAPPSLDAGRGGQEVEDLEIELLLEGIWRRYGYDLREYDRRYIRGRVQARLREEGLETASQLQERILRDPESLDGLLDDGDATFDAFFRPAKLWKALRRKAVPLLRTYPSVRAWAVGTVPEGPLYSLLLLLHEELSRPYTVYATDLRERRIGRVRSGAFPRTRLRGLAKAFASGGGRRPLEEYLEGTNGETRLRPAIQHHIVLASHNPATDASFNAFHLILAPQATLGSSGTLRERVLQLLDDSLVRFGFLVLGPREAPPGTAGRYRALDAGAGLFQKVAD
jgi:chemotaxis protein methyltransferase CheR